MQMGRGERNLNPETRYYFVDTGGEATTRREYEEDKNARAREILKHIYEKCVYISLFLLACPKGVYTLICPIGQISRSDIPEKIVIYAYFVLIL